MWFVLGMLAGAVLGLPAGYLIASLRPPEAP